MILAGIRELHLDCPLKILSDILKEQNKNNLKLLQHIVSKQGPKVDLEEVLNLVKQVNNYKKSGLEKLEFSSSMYEVSDYVGMGTAHTFTIILGKRLGQESASNWEDLGLEESGYYVYKGRFSTAYKPNSSWLKSIKIYYLPGLMGGELLDLGTLEGIWKNPKNRGKDLQQIDLFGFQGKAENIGNIAINIHQALEMSPKADKTES